MLRDAGRLAGIPAVLVHGRLDIPAPLETAWELRGAWPHARLFLVGGAGHTGMTAQVSDSLDAFARSSS